MQLQHEIHELDLKRSTEFAWRMQQKIAAMSQRIAAMKSGPGARR
jgi:hypothetical protein